MHIKVVSELIKVKDGDMGVYGIELILSGVSVILFLMCGG